MTAAVTLAVLLFIPIHHSLSTTSQ